jgi:hypothetical protein
MCQLANSRLGTRSGRGPLGRVASKFVIQMDKEIANENNNRISVSQIRIVVPPLAQPVLDLWVSLSGPVFQASLKFSGFRKCEECFDDGFGVGVSGR